MQFFYISNKFAKNAKVFHFHHALPYKKIRSPRQHFSPQATLIQVYLNLVLTAADLIISYLGARNLFDTNG